MNDKLHNYMINNILKIIFLFLFLSCANDNTAASDNIFDQSLFGIQGNLNIITWNIENFPKEDELTIDYLVETINLMELDIIALQEIRNTDSFNQLVNKLGDSWVGYRAGNGNTAAAYLRKMRLRFLFCGVRSVDFLHRVTVR